MRLILASLLSVAACGPHLQVQTMRAGGFAPAKPANCPLELHTEAMDGTMMSTYDPVGFVHITGADDGEPPNSPRLLALLKPQACALGGDIVTVGLSANVTYPGTVQKDDSMHTYFVMRKKSAAGAATTQSF